MYITRIVPKRYLYLLLFLVLIVITKRMLPSPLPTSFEEKVFWKSKLHRENQNENVNVVKDFHSKNEIVMGNSKVIERKIVEDSDKFQGQNKLLLDINTQIQGKSKSFKDVNENNVDEKDIVNADIVISPEKNEIHVGKNENNMAKIENIPAEKDILSRDKLNVPVENEKPEMNEIPKRKNENNTPENNKENEENVQAGKLNLPAELGKLPEESVEAQEEHKLIKVPIPKLIFGNNGRGRNGDGVEIDRNTLDAASRTLYEDGYKRNDFNEYLSNLISVDRLVPDSRDRLCLSLRYSDDLPDTSVIITFLNEAWSVLVRTIHSIIRTAPPHLLREIILVDDFSDYEYLKGTLEDYMQQFPKVKILRNSRREGLIRSRLIGAKFATGEVLTFLDSHIECVSGWLPPLLSRIKEDRSHVVWPSVPTIDRHTFRLPIRKSATDMSVGTFTWALAFSWEKPDRSERETDVSPIRSPTMAGGLFSIDRKYFYHIGTYDDHMMFWGGENLEISFRIWMCGGTIEVIPCSIIGHIYRVKNVNANSQTMESVERNLKRTAVVWMDDYSRLYAKIAKKKLVNYGDVSSRIALRKQLQCKSFEWYLNNVCVNAFTPAKALKYGALQSVADRKRCLHAEDSNNALVNTNNCNKHELTRQVFYVNEQEELRHLSLCVDTRTASLGMYNCHRRKGTQQFQIRNDGSIYNPRLRLCMEAMLPGMSVQLKTCNSEKKTQQWRWLPVSVDLLNK